MNAMTLASSETAARTYLPTRRKDTEALLAQGITKLPYVVVRATPGGVLVGEVLCASSLCAVAYILAKWW